MSAISRQVRDEVLERLRDVTTGFNAIYASIAADYPLADQTLTLDLTTLGRNLWLANIDPGAVEDASTRPTFPLVMLYSAVTQDNQKEKTPNFSGDITLILDIWFQWKAGNFPVNTEDQGDAIEETVFRVFAEADQDWGSGYYWNNKLGLVRAPIEYAESWRQNYQFTLTFGASL